MVVWNHHCVGEMREMRRRMWMDKKINKGSFAYMHDHQRGKSLHHPQPMRGGLGKSSTYEMVYITP
jgi:hypothetical protein